MSPDPPRHTPPASGVIYAQSFRSDPWFEDLKRRVDLPDD
jgi:hypothetical protein